MHTVGADIIRPLLFYVYCDIINDNIHCIIYEVIKIERQDK